MELIEINVAVDDASKWLEHCHASEDTKVRWSDVTMCVSVVSYHLRTNGHRAVDVYTLHECVRLFDEIN